MNCSVLTFYKKEFIIFSVEVDFFCSKIHTWGKSEAIYEGSLKVLNLVAQRLLGIVFPDLVSPPPPTSNPLFSFPLSFSRVTDGLAHLSEDGLRQTCVRLTGWHRSDDIVEGEEPFCSPTSLCDARQRGPVAAWLAGTDSKSARPCFVYKTMAQAAGSEHMTDKVLFVLHAKSPLCNTNLSSKLLHFHALELNSKADFHYTVQFFLI